MSQFASGVLAERSFPLPTTSYYQRPGSATNADPSIASVSLFPAQCPQNQSWPQYFTEQHAVPQSSGLPSYGSSSDTSSSTTACMQFASSSTTAPFVNAAENAAHFHQTHQTLNAHSRSLDYPITPQPVPALYHPTSSQRTILTPASPQPSTFPLSYGFQNNRDSSPSSHTSASDFEFNGRDWESPGRRSENPMHLVSRGGPPENDSSEVFDDAESRRSSSPGPSPTSVPTHPSVKIEPDDPDGCFIMELSSMLDLSEELEQSTADRGSYKFNLLSQSLAPPTEVPLRATQASKEMREMMGVFRLNPFAMHSLSMNGEGGESPGGLEGGKGHALWGGEAHPLDEEPTIFEFQLNINGSDGEAEGASLIGSEGSGELRSLSIRGSQSLPVDITDQLRSFSPSFSLRPDDFDGDNASTHGHDRSSVTRTLEAEYETDEQEEDSWPDTDYGSRSEVDTSSTTTRSVHTPFNDSPLQDIQARSHCVYEPIQEQSNSPPLSSPWDAVNEQYRVDELSMDCSHSPMRIPRLHTTASHPYLRKSLQSYQPSHRHSQNSPQGPAHAHSLSYVQSISYSESSLLRLSSHHSQQNAAHIPTQSIQNQGFSIPRPEHHSHIPEYPLDSSSVPNHDQHIVVPSQASYRYIRRAREARNENQEYEEPLRVYTPSNASSTSNDINGYPQPLETSMHLSSMHAHGSAVNLASNRRWSLPETGAGIGHGLGNGGPFLSS